MKKMLVTLLVLLHVTQPLFAVDPLTQHQRDRDALYRQGAGAEDGGYTAISLSMLGWGIGLAGGIALLAALVHQSRSSGAHSASVHCH
jgi:hypothetical protein